MLVLNRRAGVVDSKSVAWGLFIVAVIALAFYALVLILNWSVK